MREALEAAAAKGPVKLFFVETPANPTIRWSTSPP